MPPCILVSRKAEALNGVAEKIASRPPHACSICILYEPALIRRLIKPRKPGDRHTRARYTRVCVLPFHGGISAATRIFACQAARSEFIAQIGLVECDLGLVASLERLIEEYIARH